MDKRFVLFLFLAVLVFAILASNVWSKDLAVPSGHSITVQLSDADLAVLRAYAAEQLSRRWEEIDEDGNPVKSRSLSSVDVTEEALRLAHGFAVRQIQSVVRAQRRRLMDAVVMSDEAVMAEAEQKVTRKLSADSLEAK